MKDIRINLGNGYTLRATQNGSPYEKEICIGIHDTNGEWCQDLVIVRPTYEYDHEDKVVWNDKEFEIMVYGDEATEDYTNIFTVKKYELKGE